MAEFIKLLNVEKLNVPAITAPTPKGINFPTAIPPRFAPYFVSIVVPTL